MNTLPPALQRLIDQFSSLPSIGEKTAIRLAFYMLKKTSYAHKEFASSIENLSQEISYCSECFHLCDTHQEKCSICLNPKRDSEQLTVVETSLDLLSLEKTGVFKGKYFVLGGVISPMEGIGPDEIRFNELAKILKNDPPQELIFALPSSLEGEATTTFIQQKINSFYEGKISQMARGIPLGAQIQYTDENTLSRAFEFRS